MKRKTKHKEKMLKVSISKCDLVVEVNTENGDN